jgi:hypothetical protein
MGNKGKALKLTGVTMAAVLVLAGCTNSEVEGEIPPTVSEVSEPATTAPESSDRLINRLVALTDLQGRALYVVPEVQTRNHLDGLTEPQPFDRVYAPMECAPDTAFTPPPAGLRGVLGRSNLSDDRSRLRAEIYTAPNEAELVDYFVGVDLETPVRCTDFSVTVGDVTQEFSYTLVDAPSIAEHSHRVRYSVTQDGSTTHHLRVTAVDGLVAASLILSTAEPADQAMTDAVLRIAQQALS